MSDTTQTNGGDATDEAASFFLARDPEAATIDTHISRVVLAGDFAYKLKKHVTFPYLDFSTYEKRLAAAETEVRLNRRTAPKIYLGLSRLTREADGALALDGAGAPVEPVVVMRRFDQDDLFDALAQRGALTPALATKLTAAIAKFHREAAPDRARGGAAAMARIVEGNIAALETADLAPPAEVAALAADTRAALARLAPLLDARRAAGKVRRCHGDLTLRNICLFEGEPTPFDCIEFDEDIATIDVLYDLAFLTMDLIHRGLANIANLVFNRYLDGNDELEGAPALPLFMSVRASVRAHVTASQARQADARRDALLTEARAYFDLARAFLRPRAVALVAVGGFSGSGKSTLAAALAPALGPAPGARVLSSDRIRKRLFGAAPTTRLPPAAYAPEASERVYREMRAQAARALSAGVAVVADAVFDRPALARAIETVAEDAHAPFFGLWLEGARDALAERIAARRDDPSDATVEVLDLQMARGEAPDWHVLDAAAAPRDNAFARTPPALRALLETTEN